MDCLCRLKKIAESSLEAVIKENMNERIILEKVRIAMDELEDENLELFDGLRYKHDNFKKDLKETNYRLEEYDKQINSLMI